MDPRTVMNMMHSMLKGAGLPKNLRAEDGSVLTGIETYSDSESPEESGEVSQGILNSIGGLLARFCEAAANITESTSSMVLEEMVYGVSH